MLLDLIRALLLAALIGVLPGWFWARHLLASVDDLAARVAFSAAFSLTLVPAVALVPGRLLGLGVTPLVAAFSALLVLGIGLVLYLRFGPAEGDHKEPEAPLAPPPAPLGALALIPLLPALGLALAVIFGFVQTSLVLLPIALLMLSTTVVHLVESRRTAEPPSVEPPTGDGRAATNGTTSRVAPSVALALVLALVLARAYVGVVRFDWPFLRGVDHYSHAVMANLMRSEGSVESYLVYPPGFHTMTAAISGLSGLDPLEVFPVLAPALLTLPPLALYALASRMWGRWCGVAAAFLSGLLANGSLHYFNDGMYPNMVAAQFLLVMALYALVELYRAPSARSGLAAALLGSAVVLYHPVASMYAALVLALVSVSLLPYLLLRDRERGLALLLSLALLFALSVLYAWDTYDLPQTVADLAGAMFGGASGTSATGDAVGMAIGTQKAYGIDHVIATVSQPVASLGLLGVLLVVANPGGRGGTPYALARATLFAWGLLLLVGSRTPLSGFPQRFERDLGVPLALFAAFALVAVLRSIGPPNRLPARALAILAACLVAAPVLYLAQTNLREPVAPSYQFVMTPQIAAAGEWLEEHNTGGNIMVSPHSNQVPSRMMLAMGDYSALQSFEPHQILEPRDLPPSGPEPMWDVVWVMQHPAGEHTQRILDEYDVRYIVLYKNMPDRPTADYWQLFEAYPDLYRVTFQNRDVVILAPR